MELWLDGCEGDGGDYFSDEPQPQQQANQVQSTPLKEITGNANGGADASAPQGKRVKLAPSTSSTSSSPQSSASVVSVARIPGLDD